MIDVLGLLVAVLWLLPRLCELGNLNGVIERNVVVMVDYCNALVMNVVVMLLFASSSFFGDFVVILFS